MSTHVNRTTGTAVVLLACALLCAVADGLAPTLPYGTCNGTAATNDGTGASALVNDVRGAAYDATTGNVVITEYVDFVVRVLYPDTGRVNTLAGIVGQSGALDGSGLAATFWYPHGVTMDASGTAYVGENSNNDVRKITPGGSVTTYAGSGVAASVDAVGVLAAFFTVTGVFCHTDGVVYVAEYSANSVRKIATDANVTTLTVGSIGTGLFRPRDIVVHSSGLSYVSSLRSVLKVTAAGVATEFVGNWSTGGHRDSTGTHALFMSPSAMHLDQASGILLIAEQNTKVLRSVDTATANVSTASGSPTTLAPSRSRPPAASTSVSTTRGASRPTTSRRLRRPSRPTRPPPPCRRRCGSSGRTACSATPKARRPWRSSAWCWASPSTRRTAT
jgi:hypothetical protein